MPEVGSVYGGDTALGAGLWSQPCHSLLCDLGQTISPVSHFPQLSSQENPTPHTSEG